MKSLTLFLVFLLAACAGTISSPIGKLRHVVLFKFKAGTSAATTAKIERAFAELRARIPQIQGFEWGTDVSTEGKSAGFTHCFVVTFEDAGGRDTYDAHAAHQEFKKLVGPTLAEVLVVDYVVRD